MSVEDFKWDILDKAVNKSRNVYAYEDAKHLFEKVAFDTYKPINGNSAQLWELREGDDGQKFLFALYEEPEDIVSVSKKEWTATPDSASSNVTVAYKKVPVYRIDIENRNFSQKEASNFASFIEKKAQSQEFVTNMLNSMSDSRRKVVEKLIQGE